MQYRLTNNITIVGQPLWGTQSFSPVTGVGGCNFMLVPLGMSFYALFMLVSVKRNSRVNYFIESD